MKTAFRYWIATIITSWLLLPALAFAQDIPASASSTPAPASTMHHARHGTQPAEGAAHKSAPASDAATKADPHAHMHTLARNGASSKPSSTDDKTMSPMHGMQHGGMADMDMGSMQGGSPPAGARDPDYSDGIRFKPGNDAHMMGTSRFAMVLVDRLEYFNGRSDHGAALEAEGWYGGDLDKFWWKLEGEHSQGALEDYRAEALWSHGVSAYWDTQTGLRHDGGEGPERNWAAFGIQGLAPYWFEVSATAYVGQGGRTAARLEAEYEILFTQRLILQPKLELNAYGKDDPARGIGSGLSDASFGLRLRYEVRRRFAPYVGIEWQRRLGGTADYARQGGKSASDRQFVAGIRIWL